MRQFLAVAAIALVAAEAPGRARAEDVDHPAYLSWSKQPIGTRIKLRSSTDADGHVLTTTTSTTLKEVRPDRAIFQVQRVSDATGREVTSIPERSEIVRKFPLFPGVKREDIGKPVGAQAKGEETLTLAGREFRAVWFDTKTKGDGGSDVYTRTWMTDEAPGRLIKSVIRIPQAKTVVTVELTEWAPPDAKAGPAGAVSKSGG